MANLSTRPAPAADRKFESHELSLSEVALALSGLRFGEVRIIVQDGVVVQVDRTEKRRLR